MDNAKKQKLIRTLISKRGLSHREIDVFFAVGSGINNIEASEQLFITESTIKFHLTRIFKKLEITNRCKLILIAHGLHKI